MKLKNRIALLVSILFTIIYAISAIVIYFLFSDFRQDEFEDRLHNKAVSSIKLLIEVEQVDRQLLKIIDQNSINKLYNEKTLIFDADFNLIYSSLDDTKITWLTQDLEYLKAHKTFFKINQDKELYGLFYDTNSHDFYALVTATDDLGKRKLEYLKLILLISSILFTIICWLTTSYAVKNLLYPLDLFHENIKGINESNLDQRLTVNQSMNEVDLLANEFNLLLGRIDVSYQKQKEFTSNASHELRTPIARITSQIENKILNKSDPPDTISFFRKLLKDVNQVSELISSLLLLSKLDGISTKQSTKYRIDELLYESIEKLRKTYSHFKIEFDLECLDDTDKEFEIGGSKSLLQIAFSNLLKNACEYADDHIAKVKIAQYRNHLVLEILNRGKSLGTEEQKRLFQPFMRGENSKGKTGLGLGLRIVHRIIDQHHAKISYHAPSINENVFVITFQN